MKMEKMSENNFIEALRSKSHLTLKRNDSNWEVLIPKFDQYLFKITIPDEVNEWFVSLYSTDANEEVWSDWADWFISGEINKNNVRLCLQKDIEYFIERIHSATKFKIIEDHAFKIFGKKFLKTKHLELLINEQWREIEPGELPDDFQISENSNNTTEKWCVVANVKQEVPYGPGGKEKKSGLRKFKAGAKLHLVGSYGGTCVNVIAIGQHRHSGKYIRVVININAVENLRVKKIYSKSVLDLLEGYRPNGAFIRTSKKDAEDLKQIIPKWIEL